MRAFCTVSAPLEVCASSAEQLSPGSRFLALRLLGQQQPKTLYFLVDAKSRVREVYTQTCLHFATQGMQDTELFGLAVLIDGEYMFADPESKLSKYGPKSWRSSHTHGLDANGRPLLELHFRVQFYIESPFMLKDETSRHNYYLQLRHNVLHRELPRDHADQALVLLAGLALQADLGDAPTAAAASATSTTTTQAIPSTNHQPKEEQAATAGTARNGRSLAMTTTLPKIRKRLSSYNERMLRLSTYVTSTSQAAAAGGKREASANEAAAIASSTDYFRLDEYLPATLHTAQAKSALRACHREHQGLSAAEAELLYIEQACSLHETINAHTFRMRLAKSEVGVGSAWFVIYARGIKILASEPSTFLWPNITKLSFERKKFEIRSGESRITLYAASDEKNKMLLTLCKDTHQWSMKLAARLKEVSKREEEEAESQCLHASYACSRSLMLPYKSKNEQRISVISSTSSNTTSGIVSDRVHSEDELEIMINTPPAPLAAPSTESLALAHLLDRPSVSRQTSSVGQMSLKDLEEQLAALSVVNVRPTEAVSGPRATAASNSLNTNAGNANDSSTTTTDSPNSQHNIGSQCSSTCSTVVVTTPAAPLPAALHSTSSSLELGFSHTAQNSTLSESNPDDDFLATSVRDDTESVSGVSGVYTLAHGMAAPPTETSGVYTMHSSELTGQSSELAESEKSSHYGIFQPAKGESGHAPGDSVDGGGGAGGAVNLTGGSAKKCNEFRLRSDSNISTSSSFRGDGSDPTDNKHTLLSAEELTNLIVGRGTYPSRQTVSSTLHSDCDYVTLPGGVSSSEQQQLEPEVAPPAPPPYNARHEKTGLCGPPVVPPPPVPPMPKPISLAKPKPKPELPAVPTPAPPPPVAVAPVAVTAPAAAALRRRDPPPYPTSMKPRPTSLISVASSAAAGPAPSAAGSMSSLKSEEITARFITTRPQISILKAHTSLLPDGAKPSYAAHYSSAASSSGSLCSHQLSQQSLHNSNYAGGSQASLQQHHPHQQQQHHHSHHQTHHRHSGSAAIGIPIVPYGLHHKSTASLHHHHHHQQAPPPQQACVLLPVIKPRQFLPPPPPSLPRQPPPPPPTTHPHHLAGLYSSQLAARNQLELYQQQMYSDVDYVIYPIQDPAVSQQEYLDAKQSSLLAAMAQAQPPTPHHPHSYLAYPAGWDTCKGHAIYRSTPYLPLALSTHSRYASTQNLSDTYVQLPGPGYSPLYSPSMASMCSSYEPPPPPPLHPAALAAAAAANASSLFARSRSDDNILNSLDSMPRPKVKRLPPPPPPPYVNRLKKPPMPAPSEQPPPIPSKPNPNPSMLPPRKPLTLNPHQSNSPLIKTSSGAQWAGERPRPDLSLGLNRGNSNSILAQLQASIAANSQSQASNAQANPLDIALLREKSKHLDLPLISALCNDRSLLKQTKVAVNPKNAKQTTSATAAAVAAGAGSAPAATTSTAGGVGHHGASKSLAQTQVTNGSTPTGTLSKGRKSATISHRHPQDKLPPLPVQLAEANNYVMDPAVVMKHHKSYNSQSQTQTQSQT
ncbi:protein expanded [Drosophila novamexicana]|uniref:protein expanded n=1 Tax=Drosophila novamexicana TaxID=47314 RepID=UPI0011E5BF66|nr:protein expanded [Drosophila novamexicana]